MTAALDHTPGSAEDQWPAVKAAVGQAGTRREDGDVAGNPGSVLHAEGGVALAAQTTFSVEAVAGLVEGAAAPTHTAMAELVLGLLAGHRRCVDQPVVRHQVGEEAKGVQQVARTGEEADGGARRGRQVLAEGEVALAPLEPERAES